mmetsp:Transcript_18614/g.60680  ORF Transcript_18614/g.60680 Transcript_18614/m.60680 type:complete len:233 (-) Transcript_18614:4627-5325(-)
MHTRSARAAVSVVWSGSSTPEPKMRALTKGTRENSSIETPRRLQSSSGVRSPSVEARVPSSIAWSMAGATSRTLAPLGRCAAIGIGCTKGPTAPPHEGSSRPWWMCKNQKRRCPAAFASTAAYAAITTATSVEPHALAAAPKPSHVSASSVSSSRPVASTASPRRARSSGSRSGAKPSRTSCSVQCPSCSFARPASSAERCSPTNSPKLRGRSGSANSCGTSSESIERTLVA